MSVKDRITEFKTRVEPNICERVIKEDDKTGAHLVNRKVKEKYKYYKCDYCGEEIKIEKEWVKQTGGTYELPASLTKQGKIILALHNKCLKATLKEFEED